MNEFDHLKLSTETLRELTGVELEQVAGGAQPTIQGCRPFTDTCGILSLYCWTSGGPACMNQ